MIVPVVVAAVAVLAGCTTPPAPEPTPSPAAWAAPTIDWNPADLIGYWAVADGPDAGAILTLAAGGWEMALPCGEKRGSWAFLDGDVVFDGFGGDGSCFTANIRQELTPASLVGATSIAPTPAGLTITAPAGETTLVASEAPPANPNSMVEPLPPTAQVEAFFADPAPLPPGIVPGSMVGRWIPAVDNPGDSFIEFTETDWVASDGCNGSGGQYLSLPDGRVADASSGIGTLIGCENIPVGDWMLMARSAGFDGDTLVLFDAEGAELGRLSPA